MSLCGTPGPIVSSSEWLRLSLQSENRTNNPLKSGPALAGPAGLATPPLCSMQKLGCEKTGNKATINKTTSCTFSTDTDTFG